MGEELQLALLGKLQINRAGTPVTGFVSTKAQALLCYLAVTGRPHDRQTLATLLWGEMAEAEAKGNLRTALFNLRKLVGAHLEVNRTAIGFNNNSAYWLDVERFQQALAAAGILDIDDVSQTSGVLKTPEVSLSSLRQAVELYRGDFLEGFVVRGAPTFEEWLFSQRERLRQLTVHALHTLAVQHTAQGEYAAGIDYTTRLLVLEPWREEAYRQMMILLARSGQRSAALAQYETCRHILAEELGVEPMAETTALYERLKAARVASPHNLPPQATSFVGREPELAQTDHYLNNPDCRLLTLVGPGGIGKTRLALQVAMQQTLHGAFPDGVFLINLAAVNSAELLVSGIADALNVSLNGPAAPKQQLLDDLRAKTILLVLDNFEQLLSPDQQESIELIVDLLRAASRVKLLVTSRERLNLQEEWSLALEGLTFPDRDEVKDHRGEGEMDQTTFLTGYSAVALFVQQAQRAQPGFTLSRTDAPHVVRICQLVAGLPLALELAAGWLQLYTCAEIAAEIKQDLDFLKTSLRNIPARHSSLRAVFEHSWRLLSAQEQTALRQLSIFRGGFSREAAAYVAQASRPLLAGISNKCLVRHTGTGRYEIHEFLRQYAAEKLAQIPAEQTTTEERHAHYYAEFLRRWRQSFERDPTRARLAELTLELDNIRLGWEQVIKPGQAMAVAEIQQYWYLGYLEQTGQLSQPWLVGLHPPHPGWDRGLDLHAQGVTAYQQGRYEQAKQCLTQSLSLLQVSDDLLYTARAKVVLGLLAYDLGEQDEAKRLLQEGLETLTSQGEHRYRGYALAYIGRIAGGPAVEPLLRESLAISRAMEDGPAVAHTLKNLGVILSLAGQTPNKHREAKAVLEESLTHCQDMDDPWRITTVLMQLGQICQTLGDAEAAEDHFRLALTEAVRGQFSPLILEILVGLAGLWLNQSSPLPKKWAQLIAAMMTVVLNHPARTRQIERQAAALLAQVETHLPMAAEVAGREEGQILETVVQQILNS